MKPRFVTFEGLDGSGKSTHLQDAVTWFERAGIPVVATHEPGGTPLGDAIRSLFLDPQWGEVDGIVETLLVFASRRQHLLEVVDPALAAGRVVLCDRFTDSTFAYQGYGRGVGQDLLREADRLATGSRIPDRTLLFDLLPEVAQARRQGFEGGANNDRLDAEELAFYAAVRQGYLESAAREPNRFTVIDSSGSREATREQVEQALADLLEPAS